MADVSFEEPTTVDRALKPASWRPPGKRVGVCRAVRRRSRTASRLNLAVAVTLGVIGTAVAQPAEDGMAPGASERLAFDAADTDGDGFVSEAELARDAAAGFSGLDRDRSRTLTPQELGPHDPAKFSQVDDDGDGVLTFREVMVNKTQALQAGDKNSDGGLSFQEMVDSVEAD